MRQMDKKKRIVWQKHIGMAFMLLLGVICGFIIVWSIDRVSAELSLGQGILFFSALLLCMYLAFFFHIIVHEAGHLVFGLMTGYQFSSFRIASFMLLKENGKFKWKRLTVAGTGGQCLMIPPDMKDGKLPFVLYNLGGVFLNSIVGALFLVGYLFFSDILLLSPILLIFAVVGILIAMMNGIPMRMGAIDNDGYNAFVLSKSKEAVEALWVQLKVIEQSSKGIRLKDMPDEWFTVPTDEGMKNSMVVTRCVLACNRLMDEERFEEADALMSHLLEIESGIVGLHYDILTCERIYLELIRENRGDVIENMLTQEQKAFMKSMKRSLSVLRTQYALALLWEKNAVKAGAIKSDFEKSAKTHPYPHEIDSERKLMQIAQQKAVMQNHA